MEIISESVSFRGRFGDHFRVGDHFGGCTPTVGVLYEQPGATVGHLQLFQNKMTNASGEQAHLELTEP